MRPINEIIIHTTATRPGWWASKPTKAKVNEVRRWHVEDRGWSDIGYHFLIDRDGTIVEGRPIERMGAHVKGHNRNTIGIALFGGFGSSETDRFADNYTEEQEAALRDLIDRLQARFGIKKITGHNQYAAKACPGFDVPRWLKRQKPRKIAASKTVQASTVTAVAGAGTAGVSAVSEMAPVAQYILMAGGIVIFAAALFIFKERIQKWLAGEK